MKFFIILSLLIASFANADTGSIYKQTGDAIISGKGNKIGPTLEFLEYLEKAISVDTDIQVMKTSGAGEKYSLGNLIIAVSASNVRQMFLQKKDVQEFNANQIDVSGETAASIMRILREGGAKERRVPDGSFVESDRGLIECHATGFRGKTYKSCTITLNFES